MNTGTYTWAGFICEWHPIVAQTVSTTSHMGPTLPLCTRTTAAEQPTYCRALHCSKCPLQLQLRPCPHLCLLKMCLWAYAHVQLGSCPHTVHSSLEVQLFPMVDVVIRPWCPSTRLLPGTCCDTGQTSTRLLPARG